MMDQRARDPRPRRFDPTLLLAFLLPVFAWAPLTYPGYFVLRSGFLPIFNLADRLAHMGDPAWMPAVGRGYSLLGGEGCCAYLLAALPAALGAGHADAIKLVFGLSFVAGSVGAYVWTRRRLADGWPALVAAAVYVLNPISLGTVYSRGAVAEAVLLGHCAVGAVGGGSRRWAGGGSAAVILGGTGRLRGVDAGGAGARAAWRDWLCTCSRCERCVTSLCGGWGCRWRGWGRGSSWARRGCCRPLCRGAWARRTGPRRSGSS